MNECFTDQIFGNFSAEKKKDWKKAMHEWKDPAFLEIVTRWCVHVYPGT